MSEFEHLSLAELVKRGAASSPDFDVLKFVYPGTEGGLHHQARSYLELWRKGQLLAGAISHLGVTGNVALMMNNHPEFVETMVACSLLAVPFVPIDPRAMGDKLAYMLDHTDCEGLICADYCLEQVLAVCADLPPLRWILCVNETPGRAPVCREGLQVLDYHQTLVAADPLREMLERAGDTPMFMMFTSGTTGNPKAVVFSQRQYMGMADSLKKLAIGSNDVLYTGLSLTHINAQNFLRNGLALGVPTVISRKFTKSRLWQICRQYRCTIFSLLGGMIPEVFAMPEQEGDAANSVRLIMSSGMPAHLWQDFERRFGVSICEGYGATEGGSLGNPPGVGPVGSIGKPGHDWEAEILDERGQVCPPGVEGEICFRRRDGQAITLNYYKNPGASSEKVRDGWLHMGDLGHKDVQGWFFFHHRAGGGVRRNGDFVNTRLVESVLLKSGQVDDVFVYGVATSGNIAGEKTLVAALVPRDGSEFSESVLHEYCKTALEKNDVPERFQVLDAIPKTASEKPIEKACIALLSL
ncbi:AMP-binding protein [Spongiibacter nanhainus]|uniref:AMP-binding protein n=1 Tax=Spongiibacter nanhainus TaxID=2794344 RepID=A0A7T4QYX1_9GAMM|nr:AMP-binding protein [Spongiibacter nanhainus]QQD17353.1 AMP-binding protein [Spongiibacter nanhainus]